MSIVPSLIIHVSLIFSKQQLEPLKNMKAASQQQQTTHFRHYNRDTTGANYFSRYCFTPATFSCSTHRSYTNKVKTAAKTAEDYQKSSMNGLPIQY